MNSLKAEDFINQRKFSTHLVLLLISIIALIISLLNNFKGIHAKEIPGLLLLIFIQIETFIFLAGIIFRGLRTATTRKEMTRIVLSRFLLFMVVCFFAALLIILVYIYCSELLKGSATSGIFSNFFSSEFKGWSKSTIAGLSVGAVIFIFIQWQDALKREQKLREENLVFQNETLKSQVNPHFLFNSLNTLSSLIIIHPDTAERFIIRLSSIYRYILENGSKDKVPLSAEISFISDYFYLYKIRDDDKIQLEILIDENARYDILPVSLQVLVENAIKHNMATRESPLKISIYLEDHKVVVKNNLQKIATQVKTTGIGLSNLAQRVKLISGNDLEIEEIENYFIVKVPLI